MEKNSKSSGGFIGSDEKFRLLINSVKDHAIFMIDLEGCVASWNSGAQHIKGYTADEIIGKPIDIFYTEEEAKRGEPLNNLKIAAEFGHHEKEGIRVRKDGTHFIANVVFTALYDNEGNLQAYSKVTRDITERKKSEEQIAYLARLIENTSDAVFSMNTSFEIRTWNKAAEQLFNFPFDEVYGKPASFIKTLFKDDERETIRNELKNLGYWNGEIVYVKKDGSHVFVLNSGTATKDARGEIDGYVFVCRDISKRKKLEVELTKSNAEMEAFSYSVSHDLRAPLRGIIGFSSILEETYADKLDDEAKRITSVIKTNALRMGQLIDDLLNFSRLGRHDINKSIVNTNNLVKGVIHELCPEHEKKSINWIIHALPDSYVDTNSIRQVWINLIANAIKYSSKIELPRIEIGASTDSSQTVFFIKDNGAGFDEHYKDKLFKVFQRLHGIREFEGSGVGLAIVEKIVSKHGGQVWAEGQINKGAAFYFSLPKSG